MSALLVQRGWLPMARALAFGLALLTLAASGVSAQTVTWLGTTNNDWNTPTNWSPAGVPGATADIIVPAAAPAITISTVNVTVQSLTLGRGLTLSGGRTLTVTTANLSAPITFGANAVLSGGTYTISSGGNLSFPGPCSFGRLVNLTINGDLTVTGGGVRWNNVTLAGTITLGLNTRVLFEGNQTITGTWNAATTGTAYLQQFSAGTLTIAPGASVRGGDLDFGDTTCSGTTMSVINNGTIAADVTARTITIGTPLVNNGTITSGPGAVVLTAVTNNGTINAPSGSVTIGGAFNPLTGTITGNGVILTGTADLAGGTWNLGNRSFRINGTLQNGTVNIGTGNLTFPAPCSVGRLSNLTINGDFSVTGGGIRWNNVTLAGTITLGANTRVFFEGDQTITGTWSAATTSTAYLQQFSAGTLTIAPGASVRGGDLSFGDTTCSGTAMSVINSGTIAADVAARTITIGTPLVNNGTITSGPGAVVLSAVTNNGTINASAGSVTIGGAFNPLTGTITGSGVILTGTIDLAAGTWNLGNRSFRINGTLQNGTVNIGTGNLTFPAPCSVGRLSNLTINGNLTVSGGGVRWNNVTLAGTITLGANTRMFFDGDQTITGTWNAATTGSAYLQQFSAGTLTIAPGASVRGGDLDFGDTTCSGAAMSVINNGTIAADVAARTITIGTPLVNNGTITSGPGAVALSAVTNNGTINASAGSVTVTGAFNPLTGTITGNGVVLSGTTDLAGGTWNLGTRSFRINGILQNGTVNIGTGNLTFPAPCSFGRLSNLSINGNLTVNGGGVRWNNVTLAGTITLAGTGTRIAFDGDQNITGTWVAATAASAYLQQFSAGTLTIAPGASVRGGDLSVGDTTCSGTTMSVINNGTIAADAAGRTITIGVPLINNGTITSGPGNVLCTGDVTGSGTLNTTAGSLTISGTFNPLAGTLVGNGLIIGGVADLASGTWNLGTRSVRINGTLQNGTLNTDSGNLTFPAPCSFGRLSNLTINGDLSISNGGLRWNNVFLNGTITLSAASRIAFDGNQTLTGTVASAGANLNFLIQFSPGTLTIGSNATVRGSPWIIGDINCAGTAMTLINNGSIIADTVSASTTVRTVTIAAPLTNHGSISAPAGIINVTGSLSGYNAVTRSLSGGLWSAADTGRVQLSNPAALTIREVAAGTVVTLDGPSASLANNSGANALPDVSSVAGTLALVNRSAAITPSGGTLSVTGNLTLDRTLLTLTGAYSQSAAGNLTVSAYGTTPAEYGRITATGAAAVAGTITAQPASGFFPLDTDSFNIVTAASVTGAFTSFVGANGFIPIPSYTPTLARINFASCPFVITQPAAATACSGGEGSFVVGAIGQPPLSYQWQLFSAGNWANLSDGPLAGIGTIANSQSELLIIQGPQTTGFQVRVVVANNCGTVTSDPATLTLPPPCSLADVVGVESGASVCADGNIDGADFIAFINSFSIGDATVDPAADVAGGGTGATPDPDGTIDGGDFIAFINAFAIGC